MDEQSRRVLEYGKVLDIIAGYTHWEPAREIITGLLPLEDPEDLHYRQQEVLEAISLYNESSGIGADGLSDCREALVGAEKGRVLGPGDIWQIGLLAAASRQAGKYLREHGDIYPKLANRALRMGTFVPLEQLITRSISAEGQVRDSASSKLRQLRQDVASFRDRLKNQLNQILRSRDTAKMLQEPVITVRSGRYVVPVKVEYRSAFKGLVIDQSSTGATVFMEPLAAVDLGNRWRAAVLDEANEVEAVLMRISAAISIKAKELLAGCEELAWLDALLALAVYSHRCQGIVPEVAEGSDLRLVEARHPLLVQQLGKKVVPSSLELSRERRTLVVTGPNTGGKTVALKTTGLLALMALAGMPVPVCAGSRLPFLREIWADIGDEQSIDQSLSTFSAHLKQVLNILPKAGPATLVLIDELGAGTDPAEGSALGKALLEYFHEHECYTVVTTHMSELKAFASNTEGFENAAVEFDGNTLAPTYRILMGVPGRSNAIRIARNLGLPKELEKRARSLMSKNHVEVDSLLNELDAERRQNDVLHGRLQKELAEAQRLRREYELKMEDADIERQRILDEAHEKVQSLVAEARNSTHGMMRGLRRHLAELGRARSASLQTARKAAGELAAALRSGGRLEQLQELSPLAAHSLTEAVVKNLKLHSLEEELGESSSAEEKVPALKTTDIKPAPPGTPVSYKKRRKGTPLAALEQRLDEEEEEDVGDYTPFMETSTEEEPEDTDGLEELARKAVRQVEADLDEVTVYSRKNLPPRRPKPAVKKEAFQVGDHVFISRMGQNGVIISLNDRQAEVQIGQVRMYLKYRDLELIEPPKEKQPAVSTAAVNYVGDVHHRQNVARSIDLHGKTVDEALLELGYAIDDAFLNGVEEFAIVHGRGTGALRQAVRSYVREHPQVLGYRSGSISEGGIGVTVVKLK